VKKRYFSPDRPDHRRAQFIQRRRREAGATRLQASPRQCRFDDGRHVGARQRDDGCRQDAAHSIEETLEDVIQQRPLATVGLALGLGFLIGATWRR